MLLISDLHQTNFVFFPAVVESSVLARNASNYFVKLFHVRFVDLLTCEYSCLSSLLVKTPGGGGGYSQKNWVGVCDPPPKTLTLFMTKICDFPYPIYDLTKNLIPYL